MTPVSPTRRRRFRVIAILLPLALLLCVEGGLRAAGYSAPLHPATYVFATLGSEHPTRDVLIDPDPRLFWRPRPGSTSPDGLVRIGEQGFRTDFEPEKRAGVRRVICLGDSSTIGVRVAANQPWPSVVAAHFLRDGQRNVEVLNLGVPGYSSYQGRLLLEDACTQLAPDDVVVAFGAFNDWVPARGRTDEEHGNPPIWHGLRVIQLAARLAGRRVPELTEAQRAHSNLPSLATRELDGPRRVSLAEFAANLRAMHATATAAGARFLIVSEPLPHSTLERNPVAAEYREACRALAMELRVPFIDGWAAFEGAALHDHPLFLDFCHPTANGHRLLAARVHETLVEADAGSEHSR